MKVAVPTSSKCISSAVSRTFGHSNYFLIYETTDKSHFFLDWEIQQSPGGDGVCVAQHIIDIHVDTVISNKCGENVSKLLKADNIMIYKATENSAIGNIELLIEGDLLPMVNFKRSLH